MPRRQSGTYRRASRPVQVTDTTGPAPIERISINRIVTGIALIRVSFGYRYRMQALSGWVCHGRTAVPGVGMCVARLNNEPYQRDASATAAVNPAGADAACALPKALVDGKLFRAGSGTFYVK